MIFGTWETRRVFIDGEELDSRPSQKLWNHSPDGFNWGYEGSGPAQLALALLLYFTHNKRLSVRLYQQFKREVIAQLPQANFEMSEDSVSKWIIDHSGDVR